MLDNIVRVVSGNCPACRFGPRPGEQASMAHGVLLFPGSFDPLHRGHVLMAKIAEERQKRPVEYEISVRNVDKPPLDVLAATRRLKQFDPRTIVWLTRAATFAEKAELFPGCTFVVGADTVRRLVDVSYYSDEQTLQAFCSRLLDLECRFLVFGRLLDGQYETVRWSSIPAEIREIFTCIPAREFRQDVSSTDLRLRREREIRAKRIVDE